MQPQSYLFPTSASQAVDMLTQYDGQALLISGGTDLMLWMKEGKKAPAALIDLDRIEQLHQWRREGDMISLGAALTHGQVARDPQLRALFPNLCQGCGSVGAPQTRNIGTIGGNIVSAQPAADASINLVALDACCEIISAAGSRIVPIETLFLGVGKSALDAGRELMTRVLVPIPRQPYATAYQRMSPRNALSLPVINVAVRLTAEQGCISDARIVAAPVAVTPLRLRATEQLLLGRSLQESGLVAQAGELAVNEVHPRDSLQRGSGAYRKQLVRTLTEAALEQCLAQLTQ